MTQITHLFWDIGGVLLRTEDPTPRQQLAQRFGMSARELEMLVFNSPTGKQAQAGKIALHDHWQITLQQLGLPLSEQPAFEQAFFAGDRLDTNLLNFIAGLRPRCKTGIISNAFISTRPLIDGEWGFNAIFDNITLSAEIGIMKPAPEIYHHALHSLNAQPQNSLFIDDFEHNVQAARALGMHAIRFENVEQTQQQILQALTT
ncbi:MAG: hypothetical protein OHK0052_16980 [Anaerolineales bacterium]